MRSAPIQQVTCPNCGKAFTIDEAGYADIVKQVRDTDFEKQLHERLELAEHEKQRTIELAETQAAGELQKAAAANDFEIQALKAKLDAGELASRPAVELAEAKLAAKLGDQLAEKAAEVEKLKASIQASDQAKQLAVIEATTRVEKERDRLKADLELAEAQKALGGKALKDKYETQLKDRDDAIERLKDMKARPSTKMVGETLEQHCETEFNRIRATAFPKAYFEKDNDARSGSKGDYMSCLLHATPARARPRLANVTKQALSFKKLSPEVRLRRKSSRRCAAAICRRSRSLRG